MVFTKNSFYIPEGMTVTGNFIADVPGKIAGVVNGDVFVKGRLTILKNAVINGNVNTEVLEILGNVTGDIQCNGKMTLQNSCRVKGNINTLEIHIEKDAVVDGIITKPAFNKSVEEDASTVTEEAPVIAIEEPLIIAEELLESPVEEELRKEDEAVVAWF